MNNTSDININNLADILNEVDDKKKLVSYYAVANVLYYHSKYSDTNIKYTTKRILNYLNEIAIIDIDLLESIIVKTNAYYDSIDNFGLTDLSNNLGTYRNLRDVSKVSSLYSSDTEELINKHFKLYKNTIHAMLMMQEQLEPFYEG